MQWRLEGDTKWKPFRLKEGQDLLTRVHEVAQSFAGTPQPNESTASTSTSAEGPPCKRQRTSVRDSKKGVFCPEWSKFDLKRRDQRHDGSAKAEEPDDRCDTVSVSVLSMPSLS